MANPLALVVLPRIEELAIQQADVWRRMGMDNSGPLSAWLKDGTREAMPLKWLPALAAALEFKAGSPAYDSLSEAARDLKTLVQLDPEVGGPLLAERDRARSAFLSLVDLLSQAGFQVPEGEREFAEVLRKRLGR